MNRIQSIFAIYLLCMTFSLQYAYAGNPDRQGEAGAYELLLNPWARSAGLNGLVVSNAVGVDAMRFNPAGVARFVGNTQIAGAHTQYLVGSGISLNAVGLAQSVGKSGAFGLSIMSVNFGDIPLTTTAQPLGFTTFSPSYFNMGVSYSHVFKDEDGNEKISVGTTVRVVSESISNASASAVAFDAGVQYVTGKSRQVKFGLALRNIGSKMRFKGDGLAFVSIAPNGTTPLTVNQRSSSADLPSLLHIGASYDFRFPATETDSTQAGTSRLTVSGMFTANSYAQDQLGIGLEYAYRKMFMVRTGYRHESGMWAEDAFSTTSNGISAGASIEVPFKKGSNRKIAFDYAFLYTKVFKGNHSLGLRLTI